MSQVAIIKSHHSRLCEKCSGYCGNYFSHVITLFLLIFIKSFLVFKQESLWGIKDEGSDSLCRLVDQLNTALKVQWQDVQRGLTSSVRGWVWETWDPNHFSPSLLLSLSYFRCAWHGAYSKKMTSSHSFRWIKMTTCLLLVVCGELRNHILQGRCFWKGLFPWWQLLTVSVRY